jgi:hypothetical protein
LALASLPWHTALAPVSIEGRLFSRCKKDLLQNTVVEKLLELLVTVVDAELLKAVDHEKLCNANADTTLRNDSYRSQQYLIRRCMKRCHQTESND